MIFYLFFCNILIIPLISCSNITVSKSEIDNKTAFDSHQKKLLNETKAALISEGGSILPETLIMPLPKVNNSTIILGNEMGKNKVVPRKGVVYSENNTKQQDLLIESYENTTSKSITPGDRSKTNVHFNNTQNVVNGKSTSQDNISNIPKKVNNTVKHKKPLILQSDVLEHMTVKSSPGTLDQLQSPNKDVKTYLTNVNSHPGMVMPIVITILLVPMFAVLGYMALRRGQEAWKNRHYKRMDFLLDGMYND